MHYTGYVVKPFVNCFFVCLFKLQALRSAVQCRIEGGGDAVPVAQQSISEYKMEIRWV